MSFSVTPMTPPLAVASAFADVTDGGTGADNVTDAVINLGGVGRRLANTPGEVVLTNVHNVINPEVLHKTAKVVDVPTLLGPKEVYNGQHVVFWITNYSDFTTYELTDVSGTASRTGNKIYYQAPASGKAAGFTLNGKVYPLSIIDYFVQQPTITFPTADAIDVQTALTLVGSMFDTMPGYGDYFVSADWEIATDAGFTNIVQQVSDSVAIKNSWTISGLLKDTDYFVRVRYKGYRYGYSPWSPTTHFRTIAVVVPETPAITYPIEGDTGLPYSFTVTATAFHSFDPAATHVSTDWQFSTDINFGTIAHQSLNDAGNLESYPLSGLLNTTTYYGRVRYKDSLTHLSDWSAPIAFTTANAGQIERPSITSPTDASTVALTFTATASAFSVIGGSDTHVSSDWVVSNTWKLPWEVGGSNDSIVFQSLADTANLESKEITLPAAGQNYWLVVKYHGASGESWWSQRIKITAHGVNKPQISSPTADAVYSNAGSMDLQAIGYPISVSTGTDTLSDAEWEVYSGAAPDGPTPELANLVASSNQHYAVPLTDASPVNSPLMTITGADQYFWIRVRYKGTDYGYSEWSDSRRFYIVLASGGGGGGTDPVPEPIDNTPTVLYPSYNGVQNVTSNGHITVQSSSFVPVSSGDNYNTSEYQFNDTFANLATGAGNNYVRNAASYTITENGWPTGSFWVRVRHQGSVSGWTAWSSPIRFDVI